jgi:hypothetical protein
MPCNSQPTTRGFTAGLATTPARLRHRRRRHAAHRAPRWPGRVESLGFPLPSPSFLPACLIAPGAPCSLPDKSNPTKAAPSPALIVLNHGQRGIRPQNRTASGLPCADPVHYPCSLVVDGLEEIAVDKSLTTIFEQRNISPLNQCSMRYPPKISTSLPTDFVRNFCCLFQQSGEWRPGASGRGWLSVLHGQGSWSIGFRSKACWPEIPHIQNAYGRHCRMKCQDSTIPVYTAPQQ